MTSGELRSAGAPGGLDSVWSMRRSVNAHEAKTHLSRLLERAEAARCGESERSSSRQECLTFAELGVTAHAGMHLLRCPLPAQYSRRPMDRRWRQERSPW